MKPVFRLALLDALGILVLSAVLIAATGGWNLQPSGLLSMATLAAAALLVFWRVSRAYAGGEVAASRALSEGFVSGAGLAVALQVLYWAFVFFTSRISLAAVTNFEGFVNLLQQASFAGAAGAVLGMAIWAMNSLAIRRTAF